MNALAKATAPIK